MPRPNLGTAEKGNTSGGYLKAEKIKEDKELNNQGKL